MLFAQDPSFGAGPSRFIVKRDARGVAAVPLVGGAVPAPFVDRNGDGLPDIDETGAFVTATGQLAPTPFFSVDAPDASRSLDPFGRTLSGGSLVFDTSTRRTSSWLVLMTDTRALFDPDPTWR